MEHPPPALTAATPSPAHPSFSGPHRSQGGGSKPAPPAFARKTPYQAQADDSRRAGASSGKRSHSAMSSTKKTPHEPCGDDRPAARPRHGTPLAPGKPGLSLHLPAPEFSPTPSKPGEPDPRLPALMASPRATLSRCVGPALPEEEGVERFGADAAAMAHALADRGVRLLALDFDLTLVNLHTNGTWMAGWSDLREHLRPLFCALIPAVQRQGIFVSVVTFSGQTDLIRDCLTHAAGTAEHAAAIIVRGEDGSWERGATANGEGRQGFGKQHHVRSCCDEIERLSGHRPAGSEVMLVDDDEDNIDAALGGGHLSWHFRDGSVAELRAELKKLRQEG